MTETRTPLRNLIALGKIDHSTARILADKKHLSDKLNKNTAELRQAQANLASRMRVYNERKARFDREEQAIREEREKLVARRKALASLNNYKVQQAAEREIEHANRQLATREEAMLESLQELESSLAENKSLEEAAQKALSEKESIESEMRETIPALEAREKELKAEREQYISQILPAYLQNYERIRGQHFADPVVAVNAELKSCTGCNMQIRPQVMLELHKGDRIVNCSGCGRILYLEEIAS